MGSLREGVDGLIKLTRHFTMRHHIVTIQTLTAVLFVLLATPVHAADAATAAKGQCFVLIVSGHPGSELFARHYRDRIVRFHKYFTRQAHVAAANITVLTGDAGF